MKMTINIDGLKIDIEEKSMQRQITKVLSAWFEVEKEVKERKPYTRKRTRRLFTDEEKEQMIKLHEEGVRFTVIARKLKRNQSSIRTFFRDREKSNKEFVEQVDKEELCQK